MLTSRGTVDHPKPTSPGQPATIPDLSATFDLNSWPLDFDSLRRDRCTGSSRARSRLDFAAGRWKTTGDMTATNLTVGGKTLAGDTLTLAQLRGAWDVGFARDFTDVRIKSLNVNLPMGGFSVEGSIPPAPGSTSVVEGTSTSLRSPRSCRTSSRRRSATP